MPNRPNTAVAKFSPNRQPTRDAITQNLLLASLPAADLTHLSRKLELVALQRGELLHSPERELQYAYFPTSGIASLQYTCQSGETAEVASVGREGVIGFALFLGVTNTVTSALVQSEGHALRLHSRHIREEMARSSAVREVPLHYAPLLLAQIAQTSVCNRHHRVEQQVCRWLLSMLDRVPSTTLQATHELIAAALGVRREGVTEVAGMLQRAGVIRYQRGQVEVLNRAGLEARACECYGVVRRAALAQQTEHPPITTTTTSSAAVRMARHAC